MAKLTLTVVSQEKQLLTTTVDSLTAPASEGEVTILPEHVPVFTRLSSGVLTYREGKTETEIVVSKGFMDVGPNNEVMVIVDTATHARDISLEKAEAAIKAAEETMSRTEDQRELLLAEASLKQAMLELKVARRSRRTTL
ncbi:MAG: ATP synthase F1 subunit epsilon [bacterium]|nr:ATP synthase F1 subunit epsilon [bacterium]